MSAQSSAVKTCIHYRSTIYVQEHNVTTVSFKSFYDLYDNLFFRLFIYQEIVHTKYTKSYKIINLSKYHYHELVV